jgi:23S rRNA (guanine2445-N2)-methyltransferase / 23S rRNA (guanine2069-N7)-methyltransferase
MKAFALTDKGIERVALLELDELIKVKGEATERVIEFETKNNDDLFKFCYLTQSTQRVAISLASFDFSDYEDFMKKAEDLLKEISWKEWFFEDTKFRVECERIGDHDFGSNTAEQDIGGLVVVGVNKELGFSPKVDLHEANIRIYVFVNDDKAYIGIDLIGHDLSKRQYRIFTSPGILNANLSYAIMRLSGYKKKEKLVDLFCKSGVICIEAALYNAGISSSYYNKDFAFKKIETFSREWDLFFKKIDDKKNDDKQNIRGFDPLLRNLEASKKNAKLAGVDKLIVFSKLDLDWADTKIDEKTVDIVLSRIQCPSKAFGEGSARKLYKELFYQVEFFVKKRGRLCLISENLNLLKEMIPKEFKLTKEDDIYAGKQRYEYVIIEKN